MSDDARRKEKKRLKREQKRKERRREMSFRRIEHTGHEESKEALIAKMIDVHKGMARRIGDKAKAKLIERGEQPLPRFDDAMEFLMATETVRRKERMEPGKITSALQIAATNILLRLIPASETPEVPAEIQAAAAQATGILREFNSEFAREMKVDAEGA